MSIERLGSLDPMAAYNRNQKVNRIQSSEDADSVMVSQEARVKAEMLQLDSEVRKVSDVRMDKVEEIKLKLQDPNYINDAMISKVADRIMDAFGL